MKTVLVSLMAAATLPLFAQKDASIRIYPEQGNQQISKHIYGQFAEHLGTCIYGGLWVGPESEIPNTQGYRNDVLNALKELNPQPPLAGRLLRRRIPLDGRHRPERKPSENGEQQLGRHDRRQQFRYARVPKPLRTVRVRTLYQRQCR